MPEGDTIHKAANRLRPALLDQPLVRFEARRLTGDRPRAGDTIEGVQAVGKHLLIRFPRRLVLHTHMKMTGSWHLYRPGERWRKGRHLARAVVEVPEWVAVCFSAPVVRSWRDIAGQPSPISHLGPDLCLPDPDLATIVQRSRTLGDAGVTIAEALLDQRIACGIGNVYKSEALWAVGVDPFTPLASVETGTVHRLYEVAGRQLRANLTTNARVTVAGGLGVYGRHGQPCRRCGDVVAVRNHGDQARATWWCPTCQPPITAPTCDETGRG